MQRARGTALIEDLIRVDCSNVRSLREAVARCCDSLRSSGKSEYAALVCERRLRSAILTAIDSYRSYIKSAGETYGADFPWVRDEFVEKQAAYFETLVRPILTEIADAGSWNDFATLTYFLSRTDDGNVTYDGISLRLEIMTPMAEFTSFAVPVLDLYYGMYGAPAQFNEEGP